MQFRLTSLLYVFALLASAMSTFGAVRGLVLVGVFAVLFVLGPVIANEVRTLARGLSFRLKSGIGVALFTLVVVLLLPASQPARTPSLRSWSMSQAKQLALAMHNYHDDAGRLPPPYSTDTEGRPRHSWRTLLLPYIEEDPLHRLINLQEPWDSPANQRLLSDISIEVLETPRGRPPRPTKNPTHYLAVVDEQAVFSPKGSVRLADITDGPSKTIVLIEASGFGVSWYEPRDLTLDEAIDLLCGETSEEHEWIVPGFFCSQRLHGDGIHPRVVAFADGHAEAIPCLEDRELARALLTRAGGEDLSAFGEISKVDAPPKNAVVEYVIHWGRIWGLTLLITLSALALPVGWRLRTREPGGAGPQLTPEV